MDRGRLLFERPEKNIRFYEEYFYYADSSVFEVFSFSLLAGDPRTALTRPNTAVITQTTAKKYFGNEDPIGKTLRHENDNEVYQITGLIADIPQNSHMKFDALLSMATLPEDFGGWDGWFPVTYLVLRENTTLQDAEKILAKVNEEYVTPIFKDFGVQIDYWLQPLGDIHLRSNFGDNAGESGNISYIYIFAAIAFFILIIAGINYMNLATARAIQRAKDVGIRKTMGSLKSQLIIQFLTESTLLTFITLLISLLLVIELLPFFNELAGTEISAAFMLQPEAIAGFVSIILLIGIGAGSYPAFYLSNFNPAQVLKKNMGRRAGNAPLRKVLVVTQFTISIAMLICTWVVYDQLQYLHNKDLGFKQDQVVSVIMPDSTVQANYPLLFTRLKDHAEIVEVSSSSSKPGMDLFYSILNVDSPEGVVVRGIDYFFADYDFVETMGIEVLKGRNFSRDYPADTAAVLVNQSMVSKMQWDDPIGKTMDFEDGDDGTPNPVYKVIGVIQDYHQQSFFGQNNFFLNIKISTGDVANTLATISDAWADVNADKPFSYSFLDQDFQSQYKADEKRRQIFTLFSALTVVIACLGLLGLVAYTTEQRAKEIGIRKVFGANVSSILVLIYKDFLTLIAIAVLIAFPLAYFFINDWLQTFAYQTEIKWFTFVASTLVTLAITMGAISYHSLRAAMTNPVDSLKNE